MPKLKIGTLKNKLIVNGSVDLLKDNEILLTEDDVYQILRIRTGNKINTYIMVHLEYFKQ